jgi:hypothetical protein
MPHTNGHDKLLIEEVACIAFQRWNRAGRPRGRLREFWRSVEQQFQSRIKLKKSRARS